MENRRKGKGIVIGILVVFCFLSGFGLRQSRLKQLAAAISEYVSTEEGNSVAKS